ncbi:hypothetical protein GSF08_03840 [Clostridiaceae bacterium DONG20-135]|uniref:Uncharacterized protein n=1 Tax=Copranaerobaculum intestinale TaxID=2692629 RepID=A0A6N8UBF5_9FIRM|nr:hypothetical protein [Copranaerobaculum intestinale]MXQ73067.1 hypothetical protein [Copranaerobaculum intestinale]
MVIQQSASREALGEFVSQFVVLNDDVLFKKVWSREEELSLRECSLMKTSF